MPAAKSKKKSPKKSPKPSAIGRIDIVFSGPMLFVPTVSDSNITGVEVYSPRNGHPVGAVFLPGVFFSDAELDTPPSKKWPESSSFSLLDPHSYTINLTQAGERVPFPLTSIPETNHRVKPGRKLSGDWEIAIGVHGQLSEWRSHRHLDVTKGLYYGSDSPRSATVAGMQRLTYSSVTEVEFCGVSPEPTEYLSSNASRGGTLIVEGETPYQSTLLHERQAIDALAKLAGLNLHLTAPAPIAGRTHLMSHTTPCKHCIIVA